MICCRTRPDCREELIARLRHLKPSATFRQRWQYQNMMYMTAGYVVGTTWEEFTQTRIFTPLDMKRTQRRVQGNPLPRHQHGRSRRIDQLECGRHAQVGARQFETQAGAGQGRDLARAAFAASGYPRFARFRMARYSGHHASRLRRFHRQRGGR
ncbi:MAG: serine hydrolase [Anaerolinea sp.]|nr:serine hydrolase [Anaerolinea sp.]